jgi:hypothetical protein
VACLQQFVQAVQHVNLTHGQLFGASRHIKVDECEQSRIDHRRLTSASRASRLAFLLGLLLFEEWICFLILLLVLRIRGLVKRNVVQRAWAATNLRTSLIASSSLRSTKLGGRRLRYARKRSSSMQLKLPVQATRVVGNEFAQTDSYTASRIPSFARRKK